MVLGLYHIRLRGKRCISQQALQIAQRLTGDDGRNCGSNVRTGDRVEHPQRHLRYTCRLECIECAAQDDLAVLLHRVEDPHRTSVPWVPAIENFPRLGNMGVVLTACITGVVATPRSAKCRQLSSCKTGSRLSRRRIWRHNVRPLEHEEQGEAHIAPPADRRGPPRSEILAEQGKPVVLPATAGEPQGTLLVLRVKDYGKSERPPVMGWIPAARWPDAKAGRPPCGHSWRENLINRYTRESR